MRKRSFFEVKIKEVSMIEGDRDWAWRVPVRTGTKCVLVVDNDEFESSCIRESLKQIHLRERVQCVTSTAELMAYLTGIEQFGDRAEYPFPAVIVLTMNLPGVDGVTTIEWLKSSPQFCDIPVVTLGRAIDLLSYEAAMNAGAHDWMTKPFNAHDFARIVREHQIPVSLGH